MNCQYPDHPALRPLRPHALPDQALNLAAVWGSGPNNIYAVGASGTILHYLP